YGVPAYSTLGWLNWAGGDPLLSTFIGYQEGELARLVFHELAHQVVYAPGDTAFNESFATAVERLGVQRWLQDPAGPGSNAARQTYQQLDERRRQFRALTAATRQELSRIYASNSTLVQDPRTQAAHKIIAMQKFREAYVQLKAGWDGYAGYDPWVARANNASFGAQAAYDEGVPAFEALFERSGRDWQRFYQAVRLLAELPAGQRQAALGLGP
ncbi:MAG: aminopeptidase, partial [Polaromonas sp.]|nr:aminopeptidase [Polaromonas sp.]